jgi:Uma2 family endonuclease
MTTTMGRVPMVTPADDVPGPKQGQWTYNNYAALLDDGRRYEIVDGVLYMAPSPSEGHQTVVGRIFRYLASCIEDTELGRVYMAPFDVELAFNVIVQPDVLVILNAHLNKITPSRIVGAPDLVVEVASPGTATHDRFTKQIAYARAGVPEYWIADPATRTIEILVLKNGKYTSAGVFEGKAAFTSHVLPDCTVHVGRFFA